MNISEVAEKAAGAAGAVDSEFSIDSLDLVAFVDRLAGRLAAGFDSSAAASTICEGATAEDSAFASSLFFAELRRPVDFLTGTSVELDVPMTVDSCAAAADVSDSTFFADLAELALARLRVAFFATGSAAVAAADGFSAFSFLFTI